MAKLSFDQLKQQTEDSLHNSNMQNLVSLDRQLEDDIAELEFQLAWTREQRRKVAQLADNPDLQTTTAVHDLYNEKRPAFKGRRW